MKNSIERIRAVMNGELPDRAPMFDLLRNTAVIEHFTGETLTVENGAELVSLFHSDGNLNPILDDLVAAGIDGLNPIEILAGMDVGEIHRRYLHLFMAGGIDVSQLLPFGTPGQVRDAVRKAIDEAGGRNLVGSSTELNEDVPLANFLALREAVLE